MSNRYGLEIRAAASEDVPGLADLMVDCGLTITARQIADRIAALQQGPGMVLVAVEWGSPSGLIAAHWHQSLLDDRPIAEISTLIVGSADRRRGIGRLLLKAAAQAARVAGCGILKLRAAPERDDLRAFCIANGFAERDGAFVRPLRKGNRLLD